jgi:hypothetical protein
VLRLAGFDVQPLGGNRKQRPTFFSNLVAVIDPEYATAVQAPDAEFLSAYDTGGSERRTYLRAHADRLAAQYEALAAFIERHMSALQESAGREAPLVAAQEARSAAAYVRFQTAPDMRAYTERRDRGMFENLRFLAERMRPSQKIIVWGHNYHLRHENFGRRVFTIGEYAFEGEAADNSRTPYTIARAGIGSTKTHRRTPDSSLTLIRRHRHPPTLAGTGPVESSLPHHLRQMPGGL